MNLTQKSVSEAVDFGNAYLPKGSLTLIKLADLLGVSLPVMVLCFKKNIKLFNMNMSDRTITGIKAVENQMNSQEIWNWFVINKLNGDSNKCFPVTTQWKLNTSLAKTKIDKPFSYAICVFMTPDKTGSEAEDKIKEMGQADLAKRLEKLATIEGNGQALDRFIYGVIL